MFGPITLDKSNSDLCHDCCIILEEDSWLGCCTQAALIRDKLVNVAEPHSLTSCFVEGNEFGVVRGSGGDCLFDRLPQDWGVVLEEDVNGLELAY